MSDTRYLSKDFLTKFIEVYREHPALWKIKSREYTNKHLKNIGYDALIKICKKIEPNANRDFVSKKIQSLRGSFRKELKKIEQSQRSLPDQIYVPSLWYFELLQFTTDQEISNDSIDNITCSQSTVKTEDMFIEENSIEVDDSDEIETSSQETMITNRHSDKGKKKKSEKGERDAFMKACTSALQREDKIDEFEAVGANVAAKLKKMDTTQQILAEYLIQKVLTKGLFHELTKNTDVCEKQLWIPTASMTSPSFHNQIISNSSYIDNRENDDNIATA